MTLNHPPPPPTPQKGKLAREDVSLRVSRLSARVIVHCLTQAKEFKIGDQPRPRQVWLKPAQRPLDQKFRVRSNEVIIITLFFLRFGGGRVAGGFHC